MSECIWLISDLRTVLCWGCKFPSGVYLLSIIDFGRRHSHIPALSCLNPHKAGAKEDPNPNWQRAEAESQPFLWRCRTDIFLDTFDLFAQLKSSQCSIQWGIRALFQGGYLSKRMGSVIHPALSILMLQCLPLIPTACLSLMWDFGSGPCRHQPFCCYLASSWFLTLPTKIPVPFFYFGEGEILINSTQSMLEPERTAHLPFLFAANSSQQVLLTWVSCHCSVAAPHSQPKSCYISWYGFMRVFSLSDLELCGTTWLSSSPLAKASSSN